MQPDDSIFACSLAFPYTWQSVSLYYHRFVFLYPEVGRPVVIYTIRQYISVFRELFMQSRKNHDSVNNHSIVPAGKGNPSKVKVFRKKQAMSVFLVLCLIFGLMMGTLFSTVSAHNRRHSGDLSTPSDQPVIEDIAEAEEEETEESETDVVEILSAGLSGSEFTAFSLDDDIGGTAAGDSLFQPASVPDWRYWWYWWPWGSGNSGSGQPNNPGSDLFYIGYDPGEHGLFNLATYTAAAGSTTPLPPENYAVSNNENYVFAGWDPSVSDTVTETVLYIARWELKDVIVTFLLDDGSVYYSATIPSTSSLGDAMPSDPEKPGYNFSGWLYEGCDFNSDSVVTHDITVVASFNQKLLSFYVAYNNNDGTGSETLVSMSGYYGTTVSIEYPGDAVRSDFLFGGWFIDASCINRFDFSTPIGVPLQENEIVLTLYAKWTPIYTVVFTNGIDGSETVLKTCKVVSGFSAVAPDVSSLTREGYVFTGWDTAFSSVEKNLTVKAVWERIMFTVTFLGKNGITISRQVVAYGNSAVTPAVPEVEGYEFFGWDKSFTSVKSNLTINALYDKLSAAMFTVRFVDWDGSLIGIKRVEKGASIANLDIPEREGFVFTGWDNSLINIQGDISLIAQYKEVELPLDVQTPLAMAEAIPVTPLESITPKKVLQQAIEEGIPILALGKLQIPLVAPAGMEDYVYSLSNLVTVTSSSVFSGISIFKAITFKRRRLRFDHYHKAGNASQPKLGGLILSIAVEIAGLLLFLGGSNIQGLMVAFDNLTVLNTLLLIIGILGFSFGPKLLKAKNEDKYRW